MRIMFLLLLIMTFNSCGGAGGGTTTGNPIQINMQFASYNNTLAKTLFKALIPSAHADLSNLKMCFKRMRFKVADTSFGNDVELQLGELSINQEGTDLGMVEIYEGTYKRIEFDLEKDCDGTSKPSVTISTQYGTFYTYDSITIRFDGSFSASSGDLTLFVQTIVDQIKNYQASDGQIKTLLEGVSGTY